MPDIGVGAPRKAEQARVMQAVAELAEGGLAERMKLDAGVRVLVTARRALAMPEAGWPSDPASTLVLGIARGWDPAVTTAAEHLDSLPLGELDALLEAAPRWAAALRGAAGLDQAGEMASRRAA